MIGGRELRMVVGVLRAQHGEDGKYSTGRTESRVNPTTLCDSYFSEVRMTDL